MSEINKDQNLLILNLIKQVKSIGYQLSLGPVIDETNLVHIIGDETITGPKTFTQLVTASGFVIPLGTSNQFLKADGSADSTIYQQELGYIPENIANKNQPNGYPSLDSSGLIPLNQIPPTAVERLVIVTDQAARFSLTTATVQNGDTVKQNDTQVMYLVKDQTNLDSEAGYEVYKAGAASSVPWTGITGKPTDLVTGTGVAGQVSFFNGPNAITGSSGFVWDNTNKRLGINGTPVSSLDVYSLVTGAVIDTAFRVTSAAKYPRFVLNSTVASGLGQASFEIQRSGITNWLIGSDFGGTNIKDFFIHDVSIASNGLYISTSGEVRLGSPGTTSSGGYYGTQKMTIKTNGNVLIGSVTDGGYGILQVTGSTIISGDLRVNGGRLHFRANTIEDFTTANDTGGVDFNYLGYQASSGYFRNITIWNGKTGQIAKFVGNTGALLIGTNTDTAGYQLQVAGAGLLGGGLKYTKAIAQGGDLNTITDAGFYNGQNYTNGPTTGYYWITVERYDFQAIWVHQTATSFGSGNTPNRVYTRVNNGGVWTAWAEMVTTANGVTGQGTTNFLPKFTSATTQGNSRIQDTGTYIGIGVVNPPIKDIALGFQTNREIGVEQSDNLTIGRNLVVTAGRATNFVVNANAIPLNLGTQAWSALTYKGNDLYTTIGPNLYKQTNNTGGFSLINNMPSSSIQLAWSPSGNLYSATSVGLYKQTGGTGNFVLIAFSGLNVSGVTVDSNNNVYVCISNAGIHKQTNETGAFVDLAQTNRWWVGMATHPNGDIYALTMAGTGCYKQVGGVGNFVLTGNVTTNMTHITCHPNGDVYVANGWTTGGDIYKQTGGTGNFVALGQTSRAWSGITPNSLGNLVLCVGGGDVYTIFINPLGATDLNGGTLQLKAGTGKGIGQSRVEIITGTKTISGTNMQVERVVATFNEDGNSIFTGNISAANLQVQNSMAIDGTGVKVPTVDAVNNQANNIARATIATGFLDTTDTFRLSRVDDNTLGVSASQFGIAFSQKFKTPPFAPSDGIVNLTQRNIPLSAIGLTGTGTAIKFVGYRQTDDSIVFSDTQFIQSPSVCQLGIVLVKFSGGVTSFIDANRTTITIPDVAAYSNLDTTTTGVKCTMSIAAIPGTLSHNNSTGQLVGISVAWGTSNNDKQLIAFASLTSFTRLHPGNALTIVPPATFTTMDPTQYWNGTALTPIAGNPNQATVQRLLFTVRGNFVWQYGEKIHSNFVAATNNVLQEQFINILPEGTFAEVGRMAITVGCTDLNSSLAQYYPTGSGGGGGTSSGPTNWGAILGSLPDQLDLKAALDAKVGGSGVAGQIPFFTDISVIGGDTTLAWDNILKKLNLTGTLNIVASGSAIFVTSQGTADIAKFINSDTVGAGNSTVHAEVNGNTNISYCFQAFVRGTKGNAFQCGTSTGIDELLALAQNGTQAHAPIARISQSNGMGILVETGGAYGQDSIQVYHTPTATGNAFNYNVGGVWKAWLTQLGEWNAQKFITTGGTPNQVVLGDGTLGAYNSASIVANVQSGTTYTIQVSDLGKQVILTNSSPVTVTITSGLGTGFQCEVLQQGTGQVSFVPSGTTLRYSSFEVPSIVERYGIVNIINISNVTEEYKLRGELTSI